MEDGLKRLMEEDMKKLPFVEWDRFYEGKKGVDVFGCPDSKCDNYYKNSVGWKR